MNTDLLCRYMFALDWLFLISFGIVVTAAGVVVFFEDISVASISRSSQQTPE